MNDRQKVILLQTTLLHALGYLKVVIQKQDPEQCALPLSVWIDRVLLMMENVNFGVKEDE